MEPVDGVAVLVGAADITPDDQDYYNEEAQLEAFDSSGASLGTGHARFGGSRVSLEGTLDFNADACSRAAGAAATRSRAAGRRPCGAAGGHRRVLARARHERRDPGTDHARDRRPDELPRVLERARDGHVQGPGERGRRRSRRRGVPERDRAAIKYHWDVPGYGTSFYNRFGEVVLVDGTWKVTRASMCQDFALAGTYCS